MNRERSSHKEAFLDLQGTLEGEGQGDIMDFTFYPFTIEVIRLLNESKPLAIDVTNQSHIAKGNFSYKQFEEKVEDLSNKLAEHEYPGPFLQVDMCKADAESDRELIEAFVAKAWGGTRNA
ncbi:hypothetical protein JXM67_12565 [candidate division WOR-3 bacterium]|nr:hypothetical protein [candidate division WOR-3 bacterium]